MGPYFIANNNAKSKVYILILTCLWSRAVNLKICLDLSLKAFMTSQQLHIYEWGLPEKIYSDSGTQLSAASNVLKDFLKDHETIEYMSDYGIRHFDFTQYFKGNSSLGSLVEILVKLVKRLLHGSIRKNILSPCEFELLVSNVMCLTNKRPIAFKESLRDDDIANAPDTITPEILIKGYSLATINIVPQ